MKAHTSQRPKRPEVISVSLAWSMPRSIATPPGQDASVTQGYPPPPPPPAVCYRYPFIHLGKKRQSGVKFVVKETTRRRGLNPGPPDPEFEVLTTRSHTPPKILQSPGVFLVCLFLFLFLTFFQHGNSAKSEVLETYTWEHWIFLKNPVSRILQ